MTAVLSVEDLRVEGRTPRGEWVPTVRGVSLVVQPGGSVRDEEVIARADAEGLAMVFTGERHFRH